MSRHSFDISGPFSTRAVHSIVGPNIHISLIFSNISACVASILRAYYLWRVDEKLDLSWDIFSAGLCSWAEISIGIIVGCLPTLPRFFQHISTNFYGSTSGPGPARESSAATNASKLNFLARVQRPFARYGVGRCVFGSWNEVHNPRAQPHEEYLILDGLDTSPSHMNSSNAPTGWPGQGIATARRDLEYAQARD